MHRVSSSSVASLLPLDYLQASPVRGQLEPHDELSKKSGWRFLQCTDTPNELKVLLPPRTAQFYAILLKAELNELAKKRDASWDRILDIRRLKDRMIRKCQRLAHTYSATNPAARVPFLTLHAPPDFRLKEMEKWIRRQHGSDPAFKKKKSFDSMQHVTSYCCDRCANLVPQYHTVPHRRSSASANSHSARSSRRSSISEWAQKAASSVAKHVDVSRERVNVADTKTASATSSIGMHEIKSQESRFQEMHMHERSRVRASRETRRVSSQEVDFEQEQAYLQSSKHQRSTSLDASVFHAETKLQQKKREIHVIPEDPHESSTIRSNQSVIEGQCEDESMGRLSIISPDPLPVPCNGSLSAIFKDMVTSPVDMEEQDVNRDQGKGVPSDGSQSPPSEEEAADGTARSGTLRRRSSLKRNNSELRTSMAFSTKTVSWAMDRDWSHQMTKYHTATADAEAADQEWGVICDKYKEELAGLKALRRNVTETLSRLKLETEKLLREDEVIRDQEDKLRAGFEQLEQKHGQYKAKVSAVLHETDQVLALCSTKRDGQS